ncbi:MAG TPA: hypothetical protein DCK95_10025 [Anaerolineaceae bacterium]|nr:hypothetical protein [Anaerolineaceae bacterium]
MIKKIILSGMLVMLMVFVAACSGSQTTVAEDAQVQKRITVSGTGQVRVIPDVAYINIGVRNQAASVSETLDQNTLQAQAIKDELVNSGVAEVDIQTSSFNVYPQYNYDYEGNITDTVFIVENSIYVTVRNLDDLGMLLGKVTESGANSIYGISFDVTDKTEALKQSRELAIANAKNQAEEVATTAGVKLGEIISIDIYSSDTPYVMDSSGMGGGYYPQSATKVPISAGNYVISSSVTIQFAID